MARLARGGEVLVPGPQDAPAQVIDVRDMASWMVALLEEGASGAFHAVSPAAGLHLAAADRGHRRRGRTRGDPLTWVDSEFVLAAGLPDGTLPLWSGDDPDVWSMAADPAKAYASGLSPRPLADTVRDTLAWTRTVDQPDEPGSRRRASRSSSPPGTPALTDSSAQVAVYITMPRHISSEVPSPHAT